MPTSKRSLVALLLLSLYVAAAFALLRAGIYGWTTFVVLPVFLGGLASWLFRPITAWRAAGVGALSVATATCLLLLLGLEGLVCIAMALPLAVPLGAFGAWLVYWAESSKLAAGSVTALLLLPPATLTWDIKTPPPVFQVRTQIVVAATPEQVWKHVVTFSELAEPQDWFFRAGLAYPKRARIEGSGPGAIRYCEFSTGPFVEPIEVWDEPHLLRFRVTENPAPMHEWSPYGQVLPKHLHGYLISKQGQFRLTRQANGGTLLEGTTWYQHGLWPAAYWRWWSDAIIHRIHLRVLNHVRVLAEQDAGIPEYGYEVVHTYPHDQAAFTEGLFYLNGFLYEGTGLPGRSSIRKIKLETGQVLQKHELPENYFGEGIVAWKNRIIELTYTTQVGFVYDLKTFAMQRTFHYRGEGWSMTQDGKRIIMDDGTPDLKFWDPDSLKEIGRLRVTANRTPVQNLNELEWIKGEIYANIWHTDRIARIDPGTGEVIGWIDLTGLLPRSDLLTGPKGSEQVLNGIAYDSKSDRIFVTGKYWPKLFEIRLRRKS